MKTPPSLLDTTTAIRKRRVEILATQGFTSTMFFDMVAQWRERKYKNTSTAGTYVDNLGVRHKIPNTNSQEPAPKRKLIPVTIDSLCDVDGDVSALAPEALEVEELEISQQEPVRVAGDEGVVDDVEPDVFEQAEITDATNDTEDTEDEPEIAEKAAVGVACA